MEYETEQTACELKGFTGCFFMLDSSIHLYEDRLVKQGGKALPPQSDIAGAITPITYDREYPSREYRAARASFFE